MDALAGLKKSGGSGASSLRIAVPKWHQLPDQGEVHDPTQTRTVVVKSEHTAPVVVEKQRFQQRDHEKDIQERAKHLEEAYAKKPVGMVKRMTKSRRCKLARKLCKLKGPQGEEAEEDYQGLLPDVVPHAEQKKSNKELEVEDSKVEAPIKRKKRNRTSKKARENQNKKRKLQKKCFRCKQVGHFSDKCPERKKKDVKTKAVEA